MRIDYNSMGNVMLTDIPLVADVGPGLDDLIAAVEHLITPALEQKFAERATCCAASPSSAAGAARAGDQQSGMGINAPLIADRVTHEIAQFAASWMRSSCTRPGR